MPDLPAPVPPPAQDALRARVESVLDEYRAVASHVHEDRFWESADSREVVYGWGTTITPRSRGNRIVVWFDGLDLDVAVSAGSRWRPIRREWRDLGDMSIVLHGVEVVLRAELDRYR